jgi:hypothetical protein
MMEAIHSSKTAILTRTTSQKTAFHILICLSKAKNHSYISRLKSAWNIPTIFLEKEDWSPLRIVLGR